MEYFFLFLRNKCDGYAADMINSVWASLITQSSRYSSLTFVCKNVFLDDKKNFRLFMGNGSQKKANSLINGFSLVFTKSLVV